MSTRGNAPNAPSKEHLKAIKDYLVHAIFVMEEDDQKVWALITDDSMPHLTNIWAYVCAFFNLILPGVGTMLAAVLGDANINKTQLMIGLF